MVLEGDGSFAHDDADNLTKEPPQCTSLIAAYLNSITRIRMIILAQSRSIWFLLPRWCYTYFAALYKEEERTLRPIRQVAVKACQQAQADSPLGLLQKNVIYAENGSEESSFSKNLIDKSVIEQVKSKINALKIPHGFSCRPVLIHVNGVTEETIDADFFSNIIDITQLFDE